MKQNFENDKGENRVNRQNKTGKNTSKLFLGRRPKDTDPASKAVVLVMGEGGSSAKRAEISPNLGLKLYYIVLKMSSSCLP